MPAAAAAHAGQRPKQRGRQLAAECRLLYCTAVPAAPAHLTAGTLARAFRCPVRAWHDPCGAVVPGDSRPGRTRPDYLLRWTDSHGLTIHVFILDDQERVCRSLGPKARIEVRAQGFLV